MMRHFSFAPLAIACVYKTCLVSQAENPFDRNADVAENRATRAGGPILKGFAALGQFDEHLTLVDGIASALDEPRLHTLRRPYN